MFTPSKDPSTSMYFIYALSLALILYSIFRGIFSPLVTVEDYLKRAKNYVSYFRSHKKAIQILEEGLSLPALQGDDIRELHFRIGIQYFRLRDFPKAMEHFHHVLPRLSKKRVTFDKGYLDLIMSYYLGGDEETARKVYHQLLKRQYEDPRFGIVTTLNERIFKESPGNHK